MTLNTFHAAGISAKNVTLGVPRLKEVINVAKTIKAPSLMIYLSADKRKDEKSLMEMQGRIEHTTLQHVVATSSIFYDPDPLETVITEDKDLVSLYLDAPDEPIETIQRLNPWLLRFSLDKEKMIQKALSMDLIDRKIHENFGDNISVIRSDDNA